MAKLSKEQVHLVADMTYEAAYEIMIKLEIDSEYEPEEYKEMLSVMRKALTRLK